MYGKLFASAFTGSMFGAGADVFAVWAYVIANTFDSQVELNPRLLAAAIGATPERMAAAIKYLESPDPNSRSKAHNGARIIREGEFAFRVPNFDAYRAIRNEDERREYNRVKKQESRARNVKTSVNDSQAMSAQTETETERETEAVVKTTTKTAVAIIDSLNTVKIHDSGIADAFEHESHRAAYLEIRAAAARPAHFDAVLKSVHSPIAGGPAYSWVVVGQALLELGAGPDAPTAAALRAFCRRVVLSAAPGEKIPTGDKVTIGQRNYLRGLAAVGGSDAES